MRKFKAVMNPENADYEMAEIHSIGCKDVAKKVQRGAWVLNLEAESGEAALTMALGEEFGSGTDRNGVERNDCTLGDVGYTGRVFPCCGKGEGL